MTWTTERKYEAALRANVGRELWRPDSRVVERPGWRQIVTPSAPGYLNEVSLAQLDPADVEAAIDRAIDDYRCHGLAIKWYVGPTTRPEDLGERLSRRGFESWGVRAMGVSTESALAMPANVDVCLVTATNIDEYLETTMRGWSMPDDQRDLERNAHLHELSKLPQTAYFFLARVGGKAVGSAGVFLRDGYGYLVGGQVHESARGQGAYRALVAARLAFLRARCDGYAITLARASTAAPLLDRLGFETLFTSTCYLLPFRA